MEKYSTAGQATDDRMAHAHCMLDTNTYSEYVITYCLSAAAIVARTRLGDTLYVVLLSCYVKQRTVDKI